MAYELPTEPNMPVCNIGHETLWIYGPPGVGKTEFANQFPSVINLLLDATGTSKLKSYDVQILTWDEMNGYGKALKADTRFETVVVDRVEDALWLCARHVLKLNDIKHESDFDQGKGWTLVKREFTNWLHNMAALGKGLIFISHDRAERIKNATGKDYNKFVPNVQGSYQSLLAGFFDHILYFSFAEGDRIGTAQRVIHGAPSADHVAKSRGGIFVEDMEMTYEAFKAAYEKGIQRIKENNQ